jgi:hypothetical protein
VAADLAVLSAPPTVVTGAATGYFIHVTVYKELEICRGRYGRRLSGQFPRGQQCAAAVHRDYPTVFSRTDSKGRDRKWSVRGTRAGL